MFRVISDCDNSNSLVINILQKYRQVTGVLPFKKKPIKVNEDLTITVGNEYIFQFCLGFKIYNE